LTAPRLGDYLSRRDPHGYFVIPAKPEAKKIAENIGGKDAKIVDASSVILIRVKSRSKAEKLLKILWRKGLLDVEPVEDEY